MPSDSEIREIQNTHKVRVWGVSAFSDPSRLGEFAVVPFDDVAAAVAAAERQSAEYATLIGAAAESAYKQGVKDGKSVQVNWPQAYEDAVEDCISALEFMDKHPHGLIDAAAAIAFLRTIIDGVTP